MASFFYLSLFGWLFFLNFQATAGEKDFSDDLSLSFLIDSHNFGLNLKPVSEAYTDKINYRPNTQSLSGIQGSWKGFTLAYLTKAPIEQESEVQNGHTSYEDIRGAFFMGSKNQWGLIGFYNRFKGFYIENSSDIDNSIGKSDPNIQRPDMEVFSTGLAIMYIFSPSNFSLAASYLQTARQTSSGGSWLAMFATDAAHMTADSSIIPTVWQNRFGADARISSADYLTMSLSGGYGYAFIAGNFYLSMTFLIGKGQQARTYVVSGTEKSSAANTSRTNLGLSFGYNGDTFFSGFTFVLDNNQFLTDSIVVDSSLSTVRLSIGTRF